MRIRAADLKSATAYWVKIGRNEDPTAFMQADVEVVGPNRILLNTENVLGLTLSPRGDLIDTSRSLEVIWNGTDRRMVPFVGGCVTLWREGSEPASDKLVKTSELEGPISDAINTPFAIVEGTLSDDPTMREQCRKTARELADAWRELQHWSPRYFQDTEISAADRSRYSLILVGGPDENAVTRELGAQLPLEITEDRIVVDGYPFKAISAAVRLIYPNPLNADRYILISAANSPEVMSLIKHMPDNVDFVIAEKRDEEENGGQSETSIRVMVSGVFNYEWELEETLLDRGRP